MGKIKNLLGQRFGKLVVIKYAGKEKRGRSLWLCQCDCGNQKVIPARHLLHNDAKSCGCSQHQKPRTTTEDDRRLGDTLQNMKARCNNPNNTHYKNYGERGITICEEWQHVDKFREWAYNNGYKPGLTIDRIDVNGNYEPSNCRWVTNQEQQFNRTDNHLITYKGETKCLMEWANQLGINYDTLKHRVYNWNDIERAFTTPVRKLNRKKN